MHLTFSPLHGEWFTQHFLPESQPTYPTHEQCDALRKSPAHDPACLSSYSHCSTPPARALPDGVKQREAKRNDSNN
ncbi:hypothetical protein E2C01_091038 [Portunus trituberculatus]|uniref:Uncharacterized protein n=1 Tax=Portunus trituberculatus TaxID=210409 RepID=A0A5B7JCY5_PORTR|nr:hypothetical protein [Portunus trituberculatus]